MSGISIGLKEALFFLFIALSFNLILYGLSKAGVIECPKEYTEYLNNTFNSSTNNTDTSGILKTIFNMVTNKCTGVPLWLYWVSIAILVIGVLLLFFAVTPFI